jgi:haloalkane dehalogenase
MSDMNTLPTWLDRTLYPFTPRRFETSDGAVSYVDEGRGPPVVLVHGTPSYSFEFREIIRALSARHRVIALDHLGFGLSAKPGPTGKLTVRDHQRRLLALFDALDLRDVTLVVHDFGGPIGIPLALDRADRVTRLVVLNSWMWPVGDEPQVRRIDRLVRSPLGRWLYLAANISPRLLLPSALGDRRALTKALHAQYLGPFPARHDRAALYALALELGGNDALYEELWKRRHELRMPLDIVWGMADPAFGPTHLARWRDAFPKAAITELPRIGHFIAEEAPDVLVRVIDPEVSAPPRVALPPKRSWGIALAVMMAIAMTVMLWRAL